MAFIDELKQGLTEVGKTVYEKSEQFISIQKLKMKKISLKNELRDTYVEIGKQVFEERKAGSEFSGAVVQLCQKVELGQDAIAEVEAQIQEVKDQEEKMYRADVTDEPPKDDEIVVEAAEEVSGEEAYVSEKDGADADSAEVQTSETAEESEALSDWEVSQPEEAADDEDTDAAAKGL